MNIKPITFSSRYLGKVTDNPGIPIPLRTDAIFLSREAQVLSLPKGFKAYLLFGVINPENFSQDNIFVLPENLKYICNDDIVVINPDIPSIRVLYRRNATSNSILVTENCNNYCLMCSQPPRNIDDSYLVNEILSMIPLIHKDTIEIGITGGEPTLLGDNLVTILQKLKNYLPDTAVHVLTNGRSFIDKSLCEKIAAIKHADLMFGIPVYSDVPYIHDYVVQSDGVFNETIKGILNLKDFNQLVEIRVILHKQTYSRLPNLAEYITRNLLFVDHVALMGLEITGFTRANLDKLWIDPMDYQVELEEAVKIFNRMSMNLSIYNHQLCLLPRTLWGYAKQSISDWKNEYMPVCDSCQMKSSCCGFFSSSKSYKLSKNIREIQII